MLKDKNNQLSIYSILYNKIPKNHTLKLINSAIDLSFVTELLAESYNKYYGRPAKNPELIIRLLILQYLYNLSDEKVIDEEIFSYNKDSDEWFCSQGNITIKKD